LDEKDDKNPIENRRISSITSSSSLSNPRRKSSALRNEEIMKSLAALKEELSEEGHKTKNPSTNNVTGSSSTLSSSHSTTTARNNYAVLRMKAETAAEMYLGVDDAGKFLRFLDFYVSLFELNSSSPFEANDAKIVKVFNLFDGDVKKSTDFLVISEELEELGFEGDKVLSALMLNSNDREAALDFS